MRCYYTISEIETELARRNVKMEKYDYCNKVRLSSKRTTGKNVTLNVFGEMLGLHNGVVLKPDDDAGTNSIDSTSEIDINRGLDIVNIHCDLVDDTKNFYEGRMSTVLATIPLPVHRRLGKRLRSTQILRVRHTCMMAYALGLGSIPETVIMSM